MPVFLSKKTCWDLLWKEESGKITFLLLSASKCITFLFVRECLLCICTWLLCMLLFYPDDYHAGNVYTVTNKWGCAKVWGPTFFSVSRFSWCVRSLFPGLEGRLLSDDLKPEVLAALKEAAKSRGNVSFVFSYRTSNGSNRLALNPSLT